MQEPAGFQPAPVRTGLDLADCDFYHTVDLPGGGTVAGQWDLRGREADYLGHAPLAGRSVLEIGPASGHLSFWMESQGADVTAFDLGEDSPWDFVPFRGLDLEAANAARRIPISLAVGTASWPDVGDTPEALLTRADEAMYADKHRHRTRKVPAVGRGRREVTRRTAARRCVPSGPRRRPEPTCWAAPR